MKVVSPQDFSWVTPLERPAAKGEVVEVDDVLGAQLVAQGWSESKSRTVRAVDVPAPDVAPSEEQMTDDA